MPCITDHLVKNCKEGTCLSLMQIVFSFIMQQLLGDHFHNHNPCKIRIGVVHICIKTEMQRILALTLMEGEIEEAL